MLENWAKFSGFSAILAVALAGGLTWVLPDLFPPNPTERSVAECTQFSAQQNKEADNHASGTNEASPVVPGREAAQHDKGPDKRDSNSTSKYECLVAAYAGQLALFTELLAFVTAILIAVGIYQGRQLKRAVDTAERSDEILQRAYLWPGFGRNDPIGNGEGRKWFTVHNTGQTAGVLQNTYHALIAEDVYKTGGFGFELFDGREDVIPPSFGKPIEIETGLDFPIYSPMISCGWIVYEDIFGRIRRRGWKHRLNLTPDAAGNYSNPLVGCYSDAYTPWEAQKRATRANAERRLADGGGEGTLSIDSRRTRKCICRSDVHGPALCLR